MNNQYYYRTFLFYDEDCGGFGRLAAGGGVVAHGPGPEEAGEDQESSGDEGFNGEEGRAGGAAHEVSGDGGEEGDGKDEGEEEAYAGMVGGHGIFAGFDE